MVIRGLWGEYRDFVVVYDINYNGVLVDVIIRREEVNRNLVFIFLFVWRIERIWKY